MAANARDCYYATVVRPGEKINFYFAVQAGGNFDVDYEVLSPQGKRVMHNSKESSVDVLFTAQEKGDFKFCFFSTFSSYADKTIDFEILVENEVETQRTEADPGIFAKPEASAATLAPWSLIGSEGISGGGATTAAKNEEPVIKPLDTSMQKMRASFEEMMRDMRYLRMREHRSWDTLRRVDRSIFWFGVAQNALVVTVAAAQVYVITDMFTGGRVARRRL